MTKMESLVSDIAQSGAHVATNYGMSFALKGFRISNDMCRRMAGGTRSRFLSDSGTYKQPI